jgi:hypothetical protein
MPRSRKVSAWLLDLKANEDRSVVKTTQCQTAEFDSCPMQVGDVLGNVVVAS